MLVKSSVHKVWFDFLKKFYNESQNHQLENPKYTGYELMKRVEKWAKKYPKDVHIAYCDDGLFAGSFIALIISKDNNHLHGINAVFIPQCTGEKPTCMFFYMSHIKELISILEKIKTMVRKEKLSCL